MSGFVFGPHILTNTTLPGRPFSAKFRASVEKNGVRRERSGRIYRDISGRLRKDIEIQGVFVASSIVDVVAGTHLAIDHIHKSYIESARGGPPPQFGIPHPSSEKRSIEGLECLRFPSIPTLEEAWVSPELEFVIRERMKYEYGESIFALYGIVRAEPDAGLFQSPPGYRLGANPPSTSESRTTCT